MSKSAQANEGPIGIMAEHITEMEIAGSLANDDGMPIELDIFLGDSQGRRLAINVMTLNQYEERKRTQPDLGEDPEAPRVLVVNEDTISMDSLIELLKAPDVRVFEPYLYTVE